MTTRSLPLFVVALLLALLLNAPTIAQLNSDKLDPNVRAEIESFFEKMRVAFQSNRSKPRLECVDLDKIVQNVFASGDSIPEETQKIIATEFRRGLRSTLRSWSAFLSWDKIEIRHLELTDSDSAVVFARHWDDEFEVWSKHKWWIHRVDGVWKIHDMADLDMNLRMSTMGKLAMDATSKDEAWVLPMTRIIGTIQSMEDLEGVYENLEVMEADVDQLIESSTTTEIKSFALTLRITLRMNSQESSDLDLALQDCHQLAEIAPNAPVRFVLCGNVLQTLGEYDDAIESFQHYARIYGWEADICENVADCYLELSNKPKAMEFAKMGLKDNAKSWGCIFSLLIALPAKEKSRIDTYFAGIDNDEDAMCSAIDWSQASEDQYAARHVYLLLRKYHPECEMLPYYQEQFDQ